MRRTPPYPFLARLFVALLVVAALAADARALDYRALPWHLVDIWWTLERDVVAPREISLDVTIDSDPGQKTPIFIAPTGLFFFNGVRFYGGFQTHMQLTEGRRGGPLGRGLVFSRWDERRRDHARATPGGYAVSSGAEGGFVGVRKPFAWTAGRYRVTLTRRAPDPGTPEDDGAWIDYRVCALATGDCVSPGALKFDGKPLVLGRKLCSFVEIYGNGPAPSALPQTAVTFSDLRIDGKAARLRSAKAYYPGNVPPEAEARLGANGGVRIEIGRERTLGPLPVTGQGSFRQTLLPAGAPN